MNILSRLATVVACVCFTPAIGRPEEFKGNPKPSELHELSSVERLDRDIRFLASDERGGRGIGTDGLKESGDFIAQRFAELGLRTALFDDQPFQSLTVDTGTEIDDPTKNAVRITSGTNEALDLRLGETFNPLAIGASGIATAPLAFVGYGITAPQANYDDYAGLDVRGKIVIVLRKEPRVGQPNNPLGERSPTAAAYFSTKMLAAKTHGAAGVMIVNDRQTADQIQKTSEQLGKHAILQLDEAGRGEAEKTIPVVSVSRQIIDSLLTQSLGASLDEIERSIDADFRPRSGMLGGVSATIQTDLKSVDVTERNVIAELPGRGNLAEETVVVGAHYDHVGMGGIGSLAPGTVAVHNGADDNASGTAALLEIARKLSIPEDPNRRRIVFIAFTAEERGLLGSAHYVRNARFGLEQTVAMLNLDMVGRLKGNVLSVYGTGTADEFDGMIQRLNQTYQFDLDIDPSGYGPSDHQSFYEKNVPVLHFFTGLHNDYHRPSDDFDKINLNGLARITDMVSEAAHQIAIDPQRPQFQSTSRGKGIRKQKGAYLGVQLQMFEDRVQVTAVVPEGPAAQAGLQVGDILSRAGEKSLDSIDSVLNELSKRAGGEQLSFEVIRGEQVVRAEVTLGEKK
ncbi:MAG: M28 family peptidase [Pirellulaceae bacterium]